MAYEVVFTRSAKRAIKKLDPPIALRIRAEVHALARETTPDRYVKQLRVGDYRVLLQIHDNRLVILVIDIGPRDSIHRKF